MRKILFGLFTTLLFTLLTELSVATTFPEVVKLVKSAVVKINSKMENRFGSGFFINKDGYILTCAHVLKNDTAQTYEQEFMVELFGDVYAGETVIFHGVTKFDARVETVATDFDLAILKVGLKASGLSQVACLPIGESSKVLEGDEIATCGFIPDGFSPPRPIVVKGIISVLREKVLDPRLKNKVDILQLDQQTAGGLSGAPVFSVKTGVIGYMDASILPDERTKQSGFSYALAIDQVKHILSKYVKTLNQK